MSGKSKKNNNIQILEDRLIKPAVLPPAVSVGDGNGVLNETLVGEVKSTLADVKPAIGLPEDVPEGTTIEAVVTNILEELEADNSQSAASVDKPDENDSLGGGAPNDSSKTLVAVCTIPVIVNLCESGECKSIKSDLRLFYY